jgi:hypothetical protein
MVNVSGISIPDSNLARDITQFIRDTEDDLLFFHSRLLLGCSCGRTAETPIQ